MTRPLEPIYAAVFIDALFVKIRDGQVGNRPIYAAIGVDLDGNKDILGLWVGDGAGESSKFWLTALTDLKNRGVADVFSVGDAPEASPERLRDHLRRPDAGRGEQLNKSTMKPSLTPLIVKSRSTCRGISIGLFVSTMDMSYLSVSIRMTNCWTLSAASSTGAPRLADRERFLCRCDLLHQDLWMCESSVCLDVVLTRRHL